MQTGAAWYIMIIYLLHTFNRLLGVLGFVSFVG